MKWQSSLLLPVDEKMERYSRQLKLKEIGWEGQEKLRNSSVCIVGAGGLGIPAALYLAGAGVGKVHVIDDDVVEVSNLHRQVLYTADNIGEKKAFVLVDHLRKLNSHCEAYPINKRLSEINALELLADFDLVLDCSDNLNSRFVINDACILLDTPFVSASIYKHEGQLSVFNFNGGPSYRCLYDKIEKSVAMRSCEDTGVLGTLTGMLASMQANEAIKCMVGLPNILSGKVLITNILNYNTYVFNLDKKEAAIQGVLHRGMEGESNTNFSGIDLNAHQLKEMFVHKDVTMIDVRESYEFPRIESEKVLFMPQSEGLKVSMINRDHKLVCFCKSGIRSKYAALELRSMGYKAFNLVHGMSEIEKSGLFTLNHQVSQ